MKKESLKRESEDREDMDSNNKESKPSKISIVTTDLSSPPLIRSPSRPIITRSSTKPRIDWKVCHAAAASGGTDDRARQRAETLVLFCEFSRLKKEAENTDSNNGDIIPSTITMVTRSSIKPQVDWTALQKVDENEKPSIVISL